MIQLLPLLGVLNTAVPNAAVDATRPGQPAPVAVPETSLLGGLGVAGGETAGGAGFSLLATHRFEWIELGLECQGAALFSAMLGIGGVGGLHLGNDFSVRLLGSAGLHSYHGVGSGLLSNDPGVSGSVPYAGGRLVLGYSFAVRKNGPHRVVVGLIGAWDRDLDRKSKSVTYTTDDWLFGGGASDVTATHTIGQTTTAGFLVAGVEVDLTSY
jgi:hypothetical protein